MKQLSRIGSFIVWLIIPIIIYSCISNKKVLTESTQHYEYGLVYLHTKNWAQAFEEFEKAVALNPENDAAYFGLGLALYFQGRFEDAVRFYQKAITINPNMPEYHNNIAAAYAKLGRWEDVIRHCRIALEIPSYSSTEFAYYNIGSAYLNLGEVEKALEYLKKSRDKNSEYIDTHLQMGKAYFRMGDFRNAISSLTEAKRIEAISSAKDHDLEAELEFYLAKSFLGLGDIISAEAAFKAVIDKAPDSPLAKESADYLKGVVKPNL